MIEQVDQEPLRHRVGRQRLAHPELAKEQEPGPIGISASAGWRAYRGTGRSSGPLVRLDVGVAIDDLAGLPGEEIFLLEPANGRMGGILDEGGAAQIGRGFHRAEPQAWYLSG